MQQVNIDFPDIAKQSNKPKVLIVARFNAWVSSRIEAHLIIKLFERGIDIEVLTNVRSRHAISFEEKGIKVHYGHPEEKISLQGIRRIRRLIKNEGFNIIHLFNSKAVSNGVIAAMGLKVKVITYRGSGDLHWHDPMAYLTHLNPRVDLISCLSEYVRKQVDQQFLFRKRKTIVHHKAFLPQWFENIKPADLTVFGIPRNAVVASCAANYRKVKGVEYLLKASFLLNDIPDFHLLILGQGMDKKHIQYLYKRSPMRERIHFIGFREDVYQIVKASDIYIQPSLKEGLSKSIIEAMAQGVPCIASNVGGIPELVENNITGLLVPPKDPEALAKAIRKLIINRNLRVSMGKTSPESLFSRYSMEKYVNGILLMYNNILE